MGPSRSQPRTIRDNRGNLRSNILSRRCGWERKHRRLAHDSHRQCWRRFARECLERALKSLSARRFVPGCQQLRTPRNRRSSHLRRECRACRPHRGLVQFLASVELLPAVRAPYSDCRTRHSRRHRVKGVPYREQIPAEHLRAEFQLGSSARVDDERPLPRFGDSEPHRAGEASCQKEI